MADTTHTLEIKTTLKDGLTGPLRKIGTEAQDVGRKATAGLRQAETAAQKTGRAFETAFGGGVKKGLGLIANGMSSVASSSQGVEKNVLSLGMNMATGFAFGGPWGVAIAGIGTGIGMITSKLNEAEEAGKNFAASISSRIKSAADAVFEMNKAVEQSTVRLEAVRAGKDPSRAVRDNDYVQQIAEAERQLSQKEEEITKLRSARARAKDSPTALQSLMPQSWWDDTDQWKDDMGKSLTAHEAERSELENRIKGLSSLRSNENDEESAKAANEQSKKDAEEATKKQEESLERMKERKKVAQDINSSIADEIQLLRAANDTEELLVKQSREREAVEAKHGNLKLLSIKHARELKDLEAKHVEEAAKVAEKEREKVDAKAQANALIQFELDLTNATSDAERLRLQQIREIAQARREGLDVATMEKRHVSEMNQLHAAERKIIDDKRKAEEAFIDSLREEEAVASTKDQKAREALETFFARKKALDAAAEKGPDALKAQFGAFKDQDKRAAAEAKAAKSDPLRGWTPDSGMDPNAYLRQLKKDDAKRKKWQNHADNIRAEKGWRPPTVDADPTAPAAGGDPTVIGGKPAPANDASGGDPTSKVADSAKTTADAAKASAESLGRAAEAMGQQATEATAAKDAAVTTGDAAVQGRDSLKEAASALKDTAGSVKEATVAAGDAASAATGLKSEVEKLKVQMKRINDALKL